MDIIANNVANSSTTGFKRQGIEFDTLHSVGHRPAEHQFRRRSRDLSRSATGPIQPTGNPLDLAIEGSGYFEVQKPDGSTHYTRSGSFQLDNQGQITTLVGHAVLGDGGPPSSFLIRFQNITYGVTVHVAPA